MPPRQAPPEPSQHPLFGTRLLLLLPALPRPPAPHLSPSLNHLHSLATQEDHAIEAALLAWAHNAHPFPGPLPISKLRELHSYLPDGSTRALGILRNTSPIRSSPVRTASPGRSRSPRHVQPMAHPDLDTMVSSRQRHRHRRPQETPAPPAHCALPGSWNKEKLQELAREVTLAPWLQWTPTSGPGGHIQLKTRLGIINHWRNGTAHIQGPRAINWQAGSWSCARHCGMSLALLSLKIISARLRWPTWSATVLITFAWIRQDTPAGSRRSIRRASCLTRRDWSTHDVSADGRVQCGAETYVDELLRNSKGMCDATTDNAVLIATEKVLNRLFGSTLQDVDVFSTMFGACFLLSRLSIHQLPS